MIVMEGSRKSATAVPSRMNSGFTQTPKSGPHFFSAGFFEGGNDDALCRARQNRAAQDYEMKGVLLAERFADLLADGADVAEVEFAVAQAGSAHAEERNVGVENRLFGCAGRVQPSGFLRLGNQVGDSGSTIGLRPPLRASTLAALRSTPVTRLP